jgi:hypothetical protein
MGKGRVNNYALPKSRAIKQRVNNHDLPIARAINQREAISPFW